MPDPVKIQIDTAANTSGADKAVDALDEVADKAVEVETTLQPGSVPSVLEEIPKDAKPAAVALDGVTESAKQTDKALEGIADETKRTERGLDNVQAGSRKLNQELARTANTSEGVASKLGGNLRGTIQQAGFQIQDFAVQVGGGTSAMTAFGQQAPQFLGVFGPAGSIAGAIVAIGAVAYNVFTKMGDDAGTAKERLDEMNEVVEKIAKNKTADLNQEFADTAAAIDLAAARALALKVGIEAVVQSENKLALAQIERAARERESATAAANAKAVTEGQPVDTQRAAADAAKRTIERQQELARQGLQTSAASVQAAQDEAQAKATALKAAEAAQQKAVELLAVEREKLAVLREQREQLKIQSEERATDDPGLQLAGALFPKLIPTTSAADAAQEKLDDPNFNAALAVAEARISELEKKITGDDGELNKNVATLEVEYLATQTKVRNLVAAAANNNEVINIDLDAAQTGAKDKSAASSSQDIRAAGERAAVSIGEDIEEALGSIGEAAASPAVEGIVGQIRALAADGVQAGEQNEIVGLFQQLLSRSEAGASENRETLNRFLANVDLSISTLRDLAAKADEQQRAINQIKSQLGSRNP